MHILAFLMCLYNMNYLLLVKDYFFFYFKWQHPWLIRQQALTPDQ